MQLYNMCCNPIYIMSFSILSLPENLRSALVAYMEDLMIVIMQCCDQPYMFLNA